ncbi:hypothetical protein AB0M28_10650 [Streptomyces sp. NPDC051940]|uniref:hypothetical protein n=1 Tax=Streptomyces sp. NPDC051940 TaxID=3155675 RepID=UPI00342E3093
MVANTVGEEEAAQLFERHVVPAPRRPDLKQFADRGHSLVMDSGWRTVADHVLIWLAANGVEAVDTEA